LNKQRRSKGDKRSTAAHHHWNAGHAPSPAGLWGRIDGLLDKAYNQKESDKFNFL